MIPPELAHKLYLIYMNSPLFKYSYEPSNLDIKLSYRYKPSEDCSENLKLYFHNPVGLAGGFDKNGKVIKSALKHGAGFHEVGTITQRPNKGNPKPRVFREPNGIRNSLGFPNDGIKIIKDRILKAAVSPIGINLGAYDWDFVPLMYKAKLPNYYHGVYYVLNLSCPTGDKFDLPHFRHLCSRIENSREDEFFPQNVILFKIGPDQSDDIEAICDTIRDYNFDGLVISNTRIFGGRDKYGVSGRVVREKSLKMIGAARRYLGPNKLIIGVGGIFTPEDAINKFAAGANVIQLYTAVAFKGWQVIHDILTELSNHLKDSYLENLVSSKTDKYYELWKESL